MNKKILAFISAFIIFCSTLSGCYDRREIDDLTYIIAVGLDKGKVEPLKLTLQYAVPKSSSGGGGGGGGGQGGGGSPLAQITLETPALNAGLNMANTFIGREVNLSHAVVVIISEELAKADIGEYIYGMARWREFRPSIYMAVCRGSAEEFLKAVKPVQEVDPSKYYDLIFRSYRYTGFIPDANFNKFYTQMESPTAQPVAVLVGLSRYKSSEEFDPNITTAYEKGKTRPFEGDFLAGDIPGISEQKNEVMGLALFDGSRMVGEMDGGEATDYLFATGKFKSAFIAVPDPKKPQKSIVLNVTQDRNPVRRVDLAGDRPKISLEVSLKADFVSIQSGFNYESVDNLNIVEKAAGDFITKGIIHFLNRTSKEFKCDICGFGQETRMQFLTWKELEEYNWLEKYKDADFDVHVDFVIRRPGMIIRSVPFITTGGKEKTE